VTRGLSEIAIGECRSVERALLGLGVASRRPALREQEIDHAVLPKRHGLGTLE
jgi:hypothetical protein